MGRPLPCCSCCCSCCCRPRTVSDERFQTGARKRLPGGRLTVGRGTDKSVSAGRVPSGPGRRLRPVRVRSGNVYTQVLPAELGVRGREMLGTRLVARRRVRGRDAVAGSMRDNRMRFLIFLSVYTLWIHQEFFRIFVI